MEPHLIEKATAWIEPYFNAEHLRRALDWLLELEPEAPESLKLAALTHDMERFFPGGPQFDPATMPPGEVDYFTAHAERSARIVGDWLGENEANDELVADVRALITLHEVGGTPAADLVQAADSLSFLEVNSELVASWVEKGRCDAERGKQQHEWMFERIRPRRARDLALPLYEAAIARLEDR